MPAGPVSGARCVGLVALGIFPVLMHVTLVLTGPGSSATFLIAGELSVVLLVSLALFKNRWPLVLVPLVAAGAALIFRSSAGVIVVATGFPHAFANAGLLVVFGASLLPDRKALVTVISERLNGEQIAPELIRYTRSVTSAWCIFFALQLLTSMFLLLFAPVAVWSFFVNVLTFPLVGAMFAMEYGYRRLRFPNHRHRGIFQVIGAFSDHSVRDIYSSTRSGRP